MKANELKPGAGFTCHGANALAFKRLTIRQAVQLENRLLKKREKGSLPGDEAYLLRLLLDRSDLVVAKGTRELRGKTLTRYVAFEPDYEVIPCPTCLGDATVEDPRDNGTWGSTPCPTC